MNTRVKKFYKKHEHIILPVTVAAASFAAVVYTIHEIVEGKEIERVSRRYNDKGSLDVRVIFKNGRTRFYHWDDTYK